VGPGLVWTGGEKLAFTGIRSPGRPAHSESLYRLSYPGQVYNKTKNFISSVLAYMVNFLMMAVATIETCRFKGFLCENFGIIKCVVHIVGNI
jgi:hypothetical protein